MCVLSYCVCTTHFTFEHFPFPHSTAVSECIIQHVVGSASSNDYYVRGLQCLCLLVMNMLESFNNCTQHSTLTHTQWCSTMRPCDINDDKYGVHVMTCDFQRYLSHTLGKC